MDNDIQTELHISTDIVARKARNNKWIDLKCSHLTPTNRGGIEAFNFRIAVMDTGLFKAEIHWDTGVRETITDKIPKGSVVYFLQGYYSDHYLRTMEKHASDGAKISQRKIALVSAVDGVCSKFDTFIGKKVDVITIDVLINLGEISHEIDIAARLECVSEMRCMRHDMDVVFEYVAKGDVRWTDFKFKSLHGVDIMIDLFDEFHVLCELTKKDKTELVWIYHELKLKFRLGLQKSYREAFMHE